MHLRDPDRGGDLVLREVVGSSAGRRSCRSRGGEDLRAPARSSSSSVGAIEPRVRSAEARDAAVAALVRARRATRRCSCGRRASPRRSARARSAGARRARRRVGARPSLPASCSLSRMIAALSSWRSRGMRTDQPRSRKWRLISPGDVRLGERRQLHAARRRRSGRSPSAGRCSRPARGPRAARRGSRSGGRRGGRRAACARRAPGALASRHRRGSGAADRFVHERGGRRHGVLLSPVAIVR